MDCHAPRYEGLSPLHVDGGEIVKLPGIDAIIQDVCFSSSALLAEYRYSRFYPPQPESGRTLPNPKWTVCTSAKRKHATSALGAASIDIPEVFVTSEDVKESKPA